MLSTLTREEMDDIELARLLLSAAEKVGYQEYNHADRLLAYCEQSSSAVGNPVQWVPPLHQRTAGENGNGNRKDEEPEMPPMGRSGRHVVPPNPGPSRLLPQPPL